MPREWPQVGRSRETEYLTERVRGAEGGVILLAGEAGFGKSRLLATALEAAAEVGRPTAMGICPGLSLRTAADAPVLMGEARPFGPWRDALRLYSAAVQADASPLPPPFGSGHRAETRYDLALDVADFLDRTSRGRQAPVIALEDLHWADSASLEMLHHASSRLARSRVVVIASYRSDEVTREHPLHLLLPGLARAGAERLDLQRLSYDDVAELARYAGRPSSIVEVYNRSGGNPFFVRQLLTAAGDALPETVQEAIDERLRRLTPDALHILRVASVAGEEFSFSLLVRILEEPEESVLRALEEALNLHLLHERGERFLFDHALVREVLYTSMIGPRRQSWHRRVARASADPDMIAYHLGQAGDSSAAPHLRDAGDRALRLGASAHAAALYERALSLSGGGAGRPEHLELMLLAAFADTGTDFERASRRTEAVLQAAHAAGDAVVAGLARRHLAFLCHERKQERAVPMMEQAHAELAALYGNGRLHALHETIYGRPPASAGAPEALASVYLWTGRPAEAERLLTNLSAPGSVDDHVRGLCALVRGDLDSTVRYFQASANAAIASRQYADAADRLVNLTHTVLFHRGDRRDVIDPLMALLEQTWRQACERAGRDPFGGRRLLMDMWVWRGNWARARREADSASHLDRRPGSRLIAHHDWLCTVLDVEQGLFEEAQRRAAPLLPPGGPGSPPPHGWYIARMYLLTTVARACRMAGDLTGAKAWLSTLDAWHHGARPSLYNYAVNLAEWAEYHRAAGETSAARQKAESLLRLGTQMRSTRLLMDAHRLLGALRVDDWAGHLSTALSLAESAGWVYDAALIRLERGTPADLSAAHETLTGLGAGPALARAEAALAKLESVRGSVPGGLTGRELEVASLVAQGLTDREIGRRLFISPRTVAGHMRNIFTKLDLPSRSALTAWTLRHSRPHGETK